MSKFVQADIRIIDNQTSLTKEQKEAVGLLSIDTFLGSVDKNFNVTILKFQRNLEKLKKWLELYQI